MKKLKLEIDALSVESFAPEAARLGRTTVHGRGEIVDVAGTLAFGGTICDPGTDTCPTNPTCPGQFTCDPSCGKVCPSAPPPCMVVAH